MTMLDETAKGVFAISATPFAEDGSLDLENTDRLVEFYLDSGVTGLTILGVMGEAPKLAPDESVAGRRELVDGKLSLGKHLTGLLEMDREDFAAFVLCRQVEKERSIEPPHELWR